MDSTTPIACGSIVIREAPEAGGSDWMVFYLPLGALGEIRPVGGYPFDGADHDGWRVPLDSWLADLGRAIWKSIPFDLGLIGFEASGELRAAQVLMSDVPETCHFGLLVPGAEGTLNYHPRTERDW
ncbi:MAG: hypothetical protein HOW73_24145 [Polyangiaceae bacterium]|nr:hypothetical protein [Polyangiaceae bacterium]